MSIPVYVLLAISVLASSMRNIFSKNITSAGGDRKRFFLVQTGLFLFAALVTGLISFRFLPQISLRDACFGAIYGLFVFLSQSFLTLAMARVSLSTCSTVYAFGFIIPTVTSIFLYHEEMTAFKAVSILLCLLAIYLMFHQKGGKLEVSWHLVIATLASGGLGVVQKVQQNSGAVRENLSFLPIAFAFAALISLIVSLACRSGKNSEAGNEDGVKSSEACNEDVAKSVEGFAENCARSGEDNTSESCEKNDFDGLMERSGQDTGKHYNRKQLVSTVIVGICFGVANAVNTMIAGKLPGMIAFPLTNLSVICFSAVASVVIFREKLRKNQVLAFIAGACGIVLLNL